MRGSLISLKQAGDPEDQGAGTHRGDVICSWRGPFKKCEAGIEQHPDNERRLSFDVRFHGFPFVEPDKLWKHNSTYTPPVAEAPCSDGDENEDEGVEVSLICPLPGAVSSPGVIARPAIQTPTPRAGPHPAPAENAALCDVQDGHPPGKPLRGAHPNQLRTRALNRGNPSGLSLPGR